MLSSVVLFCCLRQPHQAVAVRKRERLQQNGVHGRKHGGVGADTEGQREHDGRREAGSPCQCANRIPDVAQQTVGPECDVHIAGTFGLNRHVAKLPSGAVSRLFVTQAFGAELVRAFREMEGQLAVDAALDALGTKCVPQTAKPRHGFLACSGMAEHTPDTLREPRPALLFHSELFPPLGRQGVEASLPVLLGDAPFRA